MRSLFVGVLSGVVALTGAATPATALDEAHYRQAREMIDRSIEYLRTIQDAETGGWGIRGEGPEFPGVTGLVLTGEGIAGYLRNFVNLILIDQADGFLLGMAFFALLSLIFWPFKAAGRWGAGKVRGMVTHRHEGAENLHSHRARTGGPVEDHHHHWH